MNFSAYSCHLGGTATSFFLVPYIFSIVPNIIFCCRREESHVLCLVFVERIVTAKVIERLVKKETILSHFSVSYLTGNNSSTDGLTPKVQKEILDSFRSGKVIPGLLKKIVLSNLVKIHLNFILLNFCRLILCFQLMSLRRGSTSRSAHVL